MEGVIHISHCEHIPPFCRIRTTHKPHVYHLISRFHIATTSCMSQPYHSISPHITPHYFISRHNISHICNTNVTKSHIQNRSHHFDISHSNHAISHLRYLRTPYRMSPPYHVTSLSHDITPYHVHTAHIPRHITLMSRHICVRPRHGLRQTHQTRITPIARHITHTCISCHITVISLHIHSYIYHIIRPRHPMTPIS